MPGSNGEKLCPICDSPLQPGSKKCNFCGTDLTIFDIEVEKTAPVEPAPSPPARRSSIESKVREVMSQPPRREPAPAPVVQREPPAASPVREPEPEPKPAPVVEEEPEPAVEEPAPAAKAEEAPSHFACPECGAQVDVHASSCPGCGVMFAEEGAEMFQCPACNTLVNIDAKSCPGCGAMFVESEEEAAAHEAPAAQPQVEIEAPISEVAPPKPEPVTPAREERPVEPAAEVVEAEAADEAPGKKGSKFGWFKKRKKDQPSEEPAPVDIPGLADSPIIPDEVEEEAPEVRAPPKSRPAQVPMTAGAKDKGKELAHMVAAMKPVLTLANEKNIDIAESKRLIDEAAEAGRDRQLDKALEHVNRAKDLLMGRIDEHLASAIAQLKEEVAVAKDLGGDVSRARTYIGEIEKARSAGDAEAAFVYVDKVSHELLPITGRYKEARDKTAALKSLVADCESLILDTKDARTALVEANKSFEANDFERVELLVKQATDRLHRAIPDRINEEMHAAKGQLIEAKMKGVNTAPMITVLKSVRTLMKAGDYQQALREMKEFKEQMRRVM